MKISKYTILKYVCVISLEIVLAACIVKPHYDKYACKDDLPPLAIKAQLKKAEKDNISGNEEEKPLKKALENRIKKGEIVKKTPSKYKCNILPVFDLKKDVYFTKYNIYNKKTNKKVGEGYIASTCEEIGDLEKSMEGDFNYITYIKVFNPDDPSENYEVKEPGYFTNFQFEKIKE
ncbi:hypothetical protein [Lachnobacterium bovis]|uniref:Uncharacterized protein n=1 Tax=Lachnobacterium bovis TaxID=140626 RepID=A0A1H9U5K3_9FIRM|nr:hypothetical protein [Lachnobacterium bovis]SES04518.1 hypothetical protein SAMN02910429_01938 [Lachnobacterium bovis]